MPTGKGTHRSDRNEGRPARCHSGERVGVLLAAPALFALSASPVQAAGPGQHLVELCTAEGISWIALPDTGQLPPDESEKARTHATCAHALRPRNLLRPRKNRSAN